MADADDELDAAQPASGEVAQELRRWFSEAKKWFVPALTRTWVASDDVLICSRPKNCSPCDCLRVRNLPLASADATAGGHLDPEPIRSSVATDDCRRSGRTYTTQDSSLLMISSRLIVIAF